MDWFLLTINGSLEVLLFLLFMRTFDIEEDTPLCSGLAFAPREIDDYSATL
jgi:hypothetical protein